METTVTRARKFFEANPLHGYTTLQLARELRVTVEEALLAAEQLRSERVLRVKMRRYYLWQRPAGRRKLPPNASFR
jgi:hypothetical protein